MIPCSRGHSDPLDVVAVNSLMGVSSAVEHIFSEDCNARESIGKSSYGKGKWSK